jgi:hypothetical protein
VIYCGKLAKIPPSQHRVVRLACDRGAASIYEAHLRTIEGKMSRDEGGREIGCFIAIKRRRDAIPDRSRMQFGRPFAPVGQYRETKETISHEME